MEILKSAAAGTLESSDCLVTVEPGEGITLDLSSSVMNQYGRQIKAAVLETLERLEVQNANVRHPCPLLGSRHRRNTSPDSHSCQTPPPFTLHPPGSHRQRSFGGKKKACLVRDISSEARLRAR